MTGIKGLMARSVWPVDGDPGAGAWHNSTAPGYEQFQWKGDTSSDEVDGHLSAYPFIYELVAEVSALPCGGGGGGGCVEHTALLSPVHPPSL